MSNLIATLYVRARESLRGQTMTEYVVVLAAIAVAAMVAYQQLGSGISQTAGEIANDLSP